MFHSWDAETQKVNICFNEATIYEQETAWRQCSFHTRLDARQE